MAEDYYKVLEVPRNASQADIQKAYRELAKKYHPDKNPDDPGATKKFQEIQAAFDVVGNPEKREMYDRYGSSFETMGAGGPRPGGGQWEFRTGSGGGFAGGPGEFSAEDIFSQFFGDRYNQEAPGAFGDVFANLNRAGGGTKRGAGRGARGRGGDIQAELEIPFATAVTGGEAQIMVQRGTGKTETITVKIPPGIEDGKKIRVRGQGEPAPSARGMAGDILITARVGQHPFFIRRGNNLYLRLPVTLGEAAAGAKVDVPTPKGIVTLTVPPGTSSGAKLRVKGQGVAPRTGPPGDLFAEVLIVLPKNLSDADRETIQQIDQRYPLEPRTNLRW